MKLLSVAILGGFCLMTNLAAPGDSVLEHKMKTIKGEEVSLKGKYAGKVLLIVNVASKCGYTPQYKQLQMVHEKFKDQGLVVIGFPCNQFGGQEPGSAADIQSFCSQNYGVTFDLFEKVEVNGDKTAPIYSQLKEFEPKGDIKWNFEKFLVGRDGKVIARFKSGVKPDAPEVIALIESELKKAAQ